MWMTNDKSLTAIQRSKIYNAELNQEIGNISLYWGTIANHEDEPKRLAASEAAYRFSLRQYLFSRYPNIDANHLHFRPTDDIFLAIDLLNKNGDVPSPELKIVVDYIRSIGINIDDAVIEAVTLVIWAARLEARRRCAIAVSRMEDDAWPDPADLVDAQRFSQLYEKPQGKQRATIGSPRTKRNPLIAEENFGGRANIEAVNCSSNKSNASSCNNLNHGLHGDAEQDFVPLKLEEVKSMTSLGKSTIYQMMKEGNFPNRRKFGRSSRWSKQEVAKWQNEKASVPTI